MSQADLFGGPPGDDGFCTNLLDPPWQEKGGGGRGAQNHYPLMPLHDIIATVYRCPQWNPAKNSHGWIWVTDNFLDDGMFLMRALGFKYKRTFVWVKPSIGIGYYGRGQHELLLFGVRGKLPPLRAVSSVVEGPKREHSRKPEESYATIEAISPGPRLEIFARRERPGWTPWGNEIAVEPGPDQYAGGWNLVANQDDRGLRERR